MSETDPWADAEPTTYETLNFRTERDHDSTSWQRADPRAAGTHLEQIDRFRWAVELPDGDRHVTELAVTPNGYMGRCSCDGFAFNTGPCAHLCTLRKADYVADITVASTDDALAQECSACGRPLPARDER